MVVFISHDIIKSRCCYFKSKTFKWYRLLHCTRGVHFSCIDYYSTSELYTSQSKGEHENHRQRGIQLVLFKYVVMIEKWLKTSMKMTLQRSDIMKPPDWKYLYVIPD